MTTLLSFSSVKLCMRRHKSLKTNRLYHESSKNIQNDHSYNSNSTCFAIPSAPSFPSTPIQGIIPMIGPLHISLNAQENVMLMYHGLFKDIYEEIFEGSKLAEKPKPWRTSFILEIVYGGWFCIRTQITEKFKKCRLLQYAVLTTVLDSYIPLVLSIYSIIFKLGRLNEYKNSMLRIWTMFYCFQRHHYDKNLLVWVSNLSFWRKYNNNLFNFLFNSLPATDEYPIENTHSIIRGNTNDYDEAQMLEKKVKAIFTNKKDQSNFRSHFQPPKNFTLSKNNLTSTKTLVAKKLTSIFQKICDLQDLPSYLQTIDQRSLPFGFHCDWQPDPSRPCDFPGCSKSSMDYRILIGCFHSFHIDCLQSYQNCPICPPHLEGEIGRLAKIAQEAVYNPDASSINTTPLTDENEDSLTLTSITPDTTELHSQISRMKPPTLASKASHTNTTTKKAPKKPH